MTRYIFLIWVMQAAPLTAAPSRMDCHFTATWSVRCEKESVLFIGTRFSNVYTTVDTPAEAA
jgi:hypothetical protein